jgi:hypothetical protein
MTKKKIPPLQFEIVQDRSNLIYLSVIEYKLENYLTIIDNISDNEITAFVLDYAEQEGINIKEFLSIANLWYYKNSNKHPFSVEIAKHDLTHKIGKIIKTFDISFVSRVIGCPFFFNMATKKIKRRRVIPIPECVEIKLKKTA